MAQTVKNLPAVRETWVRSLGREDPLEKEMATHSSILAWRIPWTEKSGRLQAMDSQRVRHNWVTDTPNANSNEANLKTARTYTVIEHLISKSLYQSLYEGKKNACLLFFTDIFEVLLEARQSNWQHTVT